MSKKLFSILFLCLIVFFGGVVVFRSLKKSNYAGSSSFDMSNSLSSSDLGLFADMKPWVDYPVPENRPRWEPSIFRYVSLLERPMPSLVPRFALRDPRLLYWYPRKFRVDLEVSVDEVESMLTQRFPVRFRVEGRYWYKTERIFVGYIERFPKVLFNRCTKVGFLLAVSLKRQMQDRDGPMLPDWLIAQYLHTSDFNDFNPSNVLLAMKNDDSCFGDTSQSRDIRYKEDTWLRLKLYSLMPDHQRWYMIE